MQNSTPQIDPTHELKIIWEIGPIDENVENDFIKHRDRSGDTTNEERLGAEECVHSSWDELQIPSAMIPAKKGAILKKRRTYSC